MNKQILLNSNKSKNSSNTNMSLTVNLNGSKRLLPLEEIIDHVDAMEQYYAEREASKLLRLHFSINTIASNVCYNRITEINIDEGSTDVKPLNLVDDISSTLGDLSSDYKADIVYSGSISNFESVADMIRDTRVSASSSVTYHCGMDIFNNHIFRTNKFKTIGKMPTSKKASETFNTLSDNMRDGNGKTISAWQYTLSSEQVVTGHAFLLDDVSTFKEGYKNSIKEKNGWLGFYNKAKFPMFEQVTKEIGGTKVVKNYLMNFNKIINVKDGNDFIEMYPEHDLFSFVPKYNSFKNRLEKNWNYCLTYPSSSTTQNIKFIDKDLNSLKIFCFDDDYQGSNGVACIKFWCFSKHGLVKGDNIILYCNDEIVISQGTVNYVDNDYVFSIVKYGNTLSDYGVYTSAITENTYEIYNEESETVITYRKSANGNYFTSDVDDDDNHYYITPSKKVYFDDNVLDLSFRKLKNGNPCKYYVRIFSRIPNWKYCSKSHSTHDLYDNENTLIAENQTIKTEFENTIGQNGFARTIYNDEVASIVFNDDIDVSDLRDNLGRPLHEIFLTVVKNNSGYREWYGKNDNDLHYDSDNIEYSHCFGKVSCAFELSSYSQINSNYNSSLLLTSDSVQDYERGLLVSLINDRKYKCIDSLGAEKEKMFDIEIDEIEYNQWSENCTNEEHTYQGDINFYGDLCCFSEDTQEEETIQEIDYRFNTVQREMNSAKYPTAYEKFRYMIYDEFESDDMDADGFSIEEEKKQLSKYKEGYRYHPHFRIEIKGLSTTMQTMTPTMYPIKSIENLFNSAERSEYKIITRSPHKFSPAQHLNMFSTDKKQLYTCVVVEVLDYYSFIALILDEDNNDVPNIFTNEVDTLRMFYRDTDAIPIYARFLTDGSCRYCWREVTQNGTIGSNDEEVYPFVNGAIYIDKSFNLFVKRQNPNLAITEFPADYDADEITDDETDNYYEEEDIEC